MKPRQLIKKYLAEIPHSIQNPLLKLTDLEIQLEEMDFQKSKNEAALKQRFTQIEPVDHQTRFLDEFKAQEIPGERYICDAIQHILEFKLPEDELKESRLVLNNLQDKPVQAGMRLFAALEKRHLPAARAVKKLLEDRLRPASLGASKIANLDQLLKDISDLKDAINPLLELDIEKIPGLLKINEFIEFYLRYRQQDVKDEAANNAIKNVLARIKNAGAKDSGARDGIEFCIYLEKRNFGEIADKLRNLIENYFSLTPDQNKLAEFELAVGRISSLKVILNKMPDSVSKDNLAFAQIILLIHQYLSETDKQKAEKIGTALENKILYCKLFEDVARLKALLPKDTRVREHKENALDNALKEDSLTLTSSEEAEAVFRRKRLAELDVQLTHLRPIPTSVTTAAQTVLVDVCVAINDYLGLKSDVAPVTNAVTMLLQAISVKASSVPVAEVKAEDLFAQMIADGKKQAIVREREEKEKKEEQARLAAAKAEADKIAKAALEHKQCVRLTSSGYAGRYTANDLVAHLQLHKPARIRIAKILVTLKPHLSEIKSEKTKRCLGDIETLSLGIKTKLDTIQANAQSLIQRKDFYFNLPSPPDKLIIPDNEFKVLRQHLKVMRLYLKNLLKWLNDPSFDALHQEAHTVHTPTRLVSVAPDESELKTELKIGVVDTAAPSQSAQQQAESTSVVPEKVETSAIFTPLPRLVATVPDEPTEAPLPPQSAQAGNADAATGDDDVIVATIINPYRIGRPQPAIRESKIPTVAASESRSAREARKPTLVSSGSGPVRETMGEHKRSESGWDAKSIQTPAETQPASYDDSAPLKLTRPGSTPNLRQPLLSERPSDADLEQPAPAPEKSGWQKCCEWFSGAWKAICGCAAGVRDWASDVWDKIIATCCPGTRTHHSNSADQTEMGATGGGNYVALVDQPEPDQPRSGRGRASRRNRGTYADQLNRRIGVPTSHGSEEKEAAHSAVQGSSYTKLVVRDEEPVMNHANRPAARRRTSSNS